MCRPAARKNRGTLRTSLNDSPIHFIANSDYFDFSQQAQKKYKCSL